jgi:hypothetical protein
MRVLLTLVIVAAALPARADDIVLRDGRHLTGTLSLDETGHLRLVAADRSVIASDRVGHVRFPPTAPAPFRAGAVHQVLLTGDQHVTGELLSLEGKELLLRAPWRQRLTLPRAAVVGVVNLRGQLLVHDEDFEKGLESWKMTGAPRLTDGLHTSGGHGLLLDAPGQSATYRLSSPLDAGSVGVNFHVPDRAAGATWQVQTGFQGPAGPQEVRVGVVGEARAYTVEAPAPRDEGAPVAPSAGWHRLAVEFGLTSLLVTIDDVVLWYSRGKGPGGPLREVRLACVAGQGAVRGAAAFDEFTLTCRVEALPRPITPPVQDETWLAGGDEVFGRLTRLDRRGLELEARSARRAYSWAEARGAFLRRDGTTPATTDGAHVRIWLRPAAGEERDELEGVLRAIDERRLTLRHPALGDLEIERARLLRLQPLFHGRRVELDNGARRLGEKERAAQTEATYTLRLPARPEGARLLLTVLPRDGPLELVVNGGAVEDLDRYVGRPTGRAVRVTVPLPRDALRIGDNTISLRVRRGSGLVSEVVADVPE